MTELQDSVLTLQSPSTIDLGSFLIHGGFEAGEDYAARDWKEGRPS